MAVPSRDDNQDHFHALTTFGTFNKMGISRLYPYTTTDRWIKVDDLLHIRRTVIPTDLLCWTLGDEARSAEGTLASLFRQQFH